MREAASCVLDKTGMAGLDSAGGLQRQVAKMGALGLAVQLAYRQGTAALVQAAHERSVELRRGAKVLRAWRSAVHGGPPRLMALHELRIARRLALTGVGRMREEAREGAASRVTDFANRAQEAVETSRWSDGAAALRQWGQLRSYRLYTL